LIIGRDSRIAPDGLVARYPHCFEAQWPQTMPANERLKEDGGARFRKTESGFQEERATKQESRPRSSTRIFKNVVWVLSLNSVSRCS
jgi:hypothetical protein